MSGTDATRALLDAPYGHHVYRDDVGNSVVVLFLPNKRTVTRTAGSFDAAVFAALDAAKAEL